MRSDERIMEGAEFAEKMLEEAGLSVEELCAGSRRFLPFPKRGSRAWRVSIFQGRGNGLPDSLLRGI